MDLRRLTAEEQELEAAIEELDEDERPDVEGRSFVPAAIAYFLFLVYFGVVWLLFAGSIDVGARRVAPGAVSALVPTMVVFAVLWYATRRLGQVAEEPTPRRRSAGVA